MVSTMYGGLPTPMSNYSSKYAVQSSNYSTPSYSSYSSYSPSRGATAPPSRYRPLTPSNCPTIARGASIPPPGVFDRPSSSRHTVFR